MNLIRREIMLTEMEKQQFSLIDSESQDNQVQKGIFLFAIAYGILFTLTFFVLIYSLQTLKAYYLESLNVFDKLPFKIALLIQVQKQVLFQKIRKNLNLKAESIQNNEEILCDMVFLRQSLRGLKEKRKKIAKNSTSFIKDLKMCLFMLSFIFSGILLFISYNNNQSHRIENQNSLIQLANVSKVLTTEAERSTLSIFHAHYLMNIDSTFAKKYEKIFKLVLREPIRDIQNVLQHGNADTDILSFSTDGAVQKKLIEILKKDTCTVVEQNDQSIYNVTEICMKLYKSKSKEGYSFLKRSIFQETLDIFQKAESFKSRVSWRQNFTQSKEFQMALFKYIFFKQQIEENILNQIVKEMKSFVDK